MKAGGESWAVGRAARLWCGVVNVLVGDTAAMQEVVCERPREPLIQFHSNLPRE